MSADPYRPSGYKVDPQSWNHYSYTRNNPVNRIDPLGLEDIPDSGLPPIKLLGTAPMPVGTFGVIGLGGIYGGDLNVELLLDGGEGGGDPTQQAQLGQITPNYGKTDGDIPYPWDTAFEKAFKAIQTQKCKSFVDGVLSKHGINKSFEDLLHTAVFHFYHSGRFKNPNSPSVQYLGGWSIYQANKSRLEKGFAANIKGTDKIYILHDFIDNRTNQGRVLVHELLHVGGIISPPNGPDPVSAMDSEIRENCGFSIGTGQN